MSRVEYVAVNRPFVIKQNRSYLAYPSVIVFTFFTLISVLLTLIIFTLKFTVMRTDDNEIIASSSTEKLENSQKKSKNLPVAVTNEDSPVLSQVKWSMSSLHDKNNLVYENDVLKLNASANTVAYMEHKVKKDLRVLSCSVDRGTDKGYSWGPGMGLYWGNGSYVFVGVRSNGHLTLWANHKEVILKEDMPTPCDLKIEFQGDHLLVFANHKEIIRYPRNNFGASQDLVRFGKMGPSFRPRNYGELGEPGLSTIHHINMEN